MGSEPDEVKRWEAEAERIIRRMNELDPLGEVESQELNDLADALEVPFKRMNAAAKARINKLSADLYAEADRGRK